MLLRQSSSLDGSGRSNIFFEANAGDAVEAHEWKCIRTINGIFSSYFFFPLSCHGLFFFFSSCS